MQLASKNSELITAAAELQSTETHFSFAEVGVSLLQEQGKSKEPQPCEVKAARIAAEAALPAVESKICLLTESESILKGQVSS